MLGLIFKWLPWWEMAVFKNVKRLVHKRFRCFAKTFSGCLFKTKLHSARKQDDNRFRLKSSALTLNQSKTNLLFPLLLLDRLSPATLAETSPDYGKFIMDSLEYYQRRFFGK